MRFHYHLDNIAYSSVEYKHSNNVALIRVALIRNFCVQILFNEELKERILRTAVDSKRKINVIYLYIILIKY